MSDLIPIRLAEQACANLQAEIDRLNEKSACQAECLEAFDKKLRKAEAQAERLRIAGDYLAFHYISLGRKRWPDEPLPRSIDIWEAAKQGKDL